MKKAILFVATLLVTVSLFSQQVARQSVVLEIGTGTWCVYCPGAAMGAHDLLQSGARVAVIKYHNGDSYANTYSNARNSYYGISSFPTAKFDGILTVAGGSASSSMYPTYVQRYNQRAAIPSSFTLDLWGQNTGGLNYSAQLLVKKVADYTGGNLVLHLVVTETDIPHTWFNQTMVKDVCRLMAPNQSGTAINFSQKDFEVVNLNFTLTASWVTNNIWLVAFVQDLSTKEILQGHKVKLTSLSPAPLVSLFTANIRAVCEGEAITFTDYSLGNPTGWQWTLPGSATGSSGVQNPTVIYNAGGIHDVTLTVTNATSSNSSTRAGYINVTPLPEIPLTPSGDEIVDLFYTTSSDYSTQPAANAQTYTWVLEPSTAGAINSTGTAATVTWTPSFTGQVTLTVKAANGTCQSSFAEPLAISVINSVGIPGTGNQNISITPNPGNGLFNLRIDALPSNELVHARVYDINGTICWEDYIQTTSLSKHAINLTHLKQGVYYIILKSNTLQYSKAVTILK